MGHTCSLTNAGGLQCWGLNNFGQVGDGSFTDRLRPVDVFGVDPTTVSMLVSGTNHTCVLTTTNEVFCWGLNSSGQLGNGTFDNSNVPVLVFGLNGMITSISAGAEFTCAQNSWGEVFCWGNNSSGQLNDGTFVNSNVPVKSTGVRGAVLISGGSSGLQGITSDGTVQLWNSDPVQGIPEENNAYISAGRFADGGCTMTTYGEVFCWGGINNVEVSGAVGSYMLAIGEGHACMMTTEGLVCWGSNSSGQLGDGSFDDSDAEAVAMGLGQDVVSLTAGAAHTCAIMEDETIACWGSNRYGQLGNSTTDDSSRPINTG
jgi:alpha-tubulin suppressor-like RCC1 family protein